MNAIRIHQTGDAGVLRLETIDDPTPGPGQALVRVEAIGVNFIEIYQRTGLYKVQPPFTPGTEGAGTVEAIGPGVTTVRPGDRVGSVNLLGSYAQYALAPADRLVPLPDRVSTGQAAAVLLQGITAQYLVTSTFHLQQGQTCLVHAAAGGVGLLLCQMARRIGARVIGTVSTEEKAALAREAGADDVILYTQTDFEAEVKRLTGGAGVQVVYDSVGRTTFAKGLNCLARRGMMVLLGQSSGPVEPFDPQILNQKGSLYLTRPSLGHYTASREELLQRSADVLGWVADGSLTVRIGNEFPLARAADAQRDLESRRTTGKVLLIP
ncbi:MAG TPA: quinone oxidoreductase [Gemmatimonadales bacterium]|nr:quinone oxidoreductase [Gemmatimonadales bacterium]